MDEIMKQQTAVDWLFNQIKKSSKKTDNINNEHLFFYRLLEEAKEKEKGQIVDAGVFTFQLTDKTPYGMEYLSKLDNAISNAVDYYNETYNKQNK
jgi:hypothetical protein